MFTIAMLRLQPKEKQIKNAEILISASKTLIAQGAEAIVLGGTDLFLVFENQELPFDVIDCADIHIRHIATLAAK